MLKIQCTEEAIKNAKLKLQSRGTPNSFIRLGISGGKCNGFGYVIEFYDEQPRLKDNIFEFDGLKIIIDSKSLIYLNGTIIDWEKTMFSSGFKFVNPNVKSLCGCGASFSIK